MRMNDTIPMPGPGEFCTGAYRKGAKCCLLGWARQVGSQAAVDAFMDKLSEIVTSEHGYTFVSIFNDSIRTTDEMRAQVWLKAAKHFGYVVENKPWKAGKR